MGRIFRVKCIQISGKGKLLFNYNDLPTEEQLNDIDYLLKSDAIEEVKTEIEAPTEIEPVAKKQPVKK